MSWDTSLGQGGPAGLLTIYRAGGPAGAAYRAARAHDRAPRAAVAQVLGFLDRWLPGARAAYNGHSWLDCWADDPWAQGSYAALRPGQWTRYWGELGRAEGAVHFAGEHTSTYSQGYLDGAVESGERAAREVLHALR